MIPISSKTPVSLLSKVGSDAELVAINKEFQTKRAKELLDQILYLAISNKEIAHELCSKAAVIAGSNKELSEFTQKALKKNNGRPGKWMPWMHRILLIHYANAMIFYSGNHKEVRNELCNYVKRMHGTILSEEAIENRITKAIKDIQLKKISLDDLPDWAVPIVQQRIRKGSAIKKQG